LDTVFKILKKIIDKIIELKISIFAKFRFLANIPIFDQNLEVIIKFLFLRKYEICDLKFVNFGISEASRKNEK